MALTPESPGGGVVGAELAGYEVLVAVAGGIAAFKTAAVVSDLVKRGAGVTVAMTESATRFVGPLTFQALTGRHVLTSLWATAGGDIEHIHINDTADLVVVAPATANLLGKMACGIADDLVSTLMLSAASPVVVAPAMNDRMWAHPAVRRNVATLRDWGHHVIEPGEGWLACRHVGAGRMAEPPDIVATVVNLLRKALPKGHPRPG